jgi:hypothetical protein
MVEESALEYALRALRKNQENGYAAVPLVELAEAMEISKASVCNIMKGRQSLLDKHIYKASAEIRRIVQFYDMNPDLFQLATLENEPPQEVDIEKVCAFVSGMKQALKSDDGMYELTVFQDLDNRKAMRIHSDKLPSVWLNNNFARLFIEATIHEAGRDPVLYTVENFPTRVKRIPTSKGIFEIVEAEGDTKIFCNGVILVKYMGWVSKALDVKIHAIVDKVTDSSTDSLPGWLKDLLQSQSETLQMVSRQVALLGEQVAEVRREKQQAEEELESALVTVEEVREFAKDVAKDQNRRKVSYPAGLTNRSAMVSALRTKLKLRDSEAKLIVKLWTRLCWFAECYFNVWNQRVNALVINRSFADPDEDYVSSGRGGVVYYTTVDVPTHNETRGEQWRAKDPRQLFNISVMATLLSDSRELIAKCDVFDGLPLTSPLSADSWEDVPEHGNMRKMDSVLAEFLEVNDRIRMNDYDLDLLDNKLRKIKRKHKTNESADRAIYNSLSTFILNRNNGEYGETSEFRSIHPDDKEKLPS